MDLKGKKVTINWNNANRPKLVKKSAPITETKVKEVEVKKVDTKKVEEKKQRTEEEERLRAEKKAKKAANLAIVKEQQRLAAEKRKALEEKKELYRQNIIDVFTESTEEYPNVYSGLTKHYGTIRCWNNSRTKYYNIDSELLLLNIAHKIFNLKSGYKKFKYCVFDEYSKIFPEVEATDELINLVKDKEFDVKAYLDQLPPPIHIGDYVSIEDYRANIFDNYSDSDNIEYAPILVSKIYDYGTFRCWANDMMSYYKFDGIKIQREILKHRFHPYTSDNSGNTYIFYNDYKRLSSFKPIFVSEAGNPDAIVENIEN